MPLDEFSGDTGLQDDWDGTITTDTEFVQQQRGNWALKLVVRYDGKDQDKTDQELFFSVGGSDKGWLSVDGGETITPPSVNAKFHKNTSIQGFFGWIEEHNPELMAELRDRSQKKYDRRGPLYAALWHGISCHWDVVEDVQRRPKEGSDEWVDTKVQVIRPTRLLSADSTAKPTAGSSAKETVRSNGSTDISDNDLKTLTRLAMTHESHSAFVDAVMEETFENGETGVRNKPVMKLISKKDWYEEVRA